MESIWAAETKIRRRESLPGDGETEAVIIGAGLTGILAAYYLKQAGLQAVVLEADRIGSGQTGNTTAKITSQHGLVYHRLIRVFGREMAAHYAMANENAIEEYERLVREKGIACDFTRDFACLYSQREESILQQEAEAAESLGIGASFQRESGLPFPVAGVTRFERQARFHPLKFLAAMAEEVTVYEQTKALRVEGQKVETEKGCVRAEHIIFACHFPFINVPGYYFARMYQERSYVAAWEGTGQREGMYLGIEPGALSFRPQGKLLFLGGGGHRTGKNSQGGQYEGLRHKAGMVYPDGREIAHWSAQDCMTLDGIPYIGRFSAKRPGWYVATGFGKWGMTSAMVSAQILTALATGRECPEKDIFSPRRRFTAGAAKKLACHGGHTAKGLAKHFLPSGEGDIIPNCPHMGCRLEWNPEEESYDCPCHGSRFGRKGQFVDCPAQTGCRRKNE